MILNELCNSIIKKLSHRHFKSAFSEENNKNMRKFWVVPTTFVQDCSFITRGGHIDKVSIKAKLRLRISTAATFAEDLATDRETSGHRLDRESFTNDFCVSEITFLNEIVYLIVVHKDRTWQIK